MMVVGLALGALIVLAPSIAALLAWKLLPDFETSEMLPVILLLTHGVAFRAGDDWAFECMKQRCPTESFLCLLDRDCRSFVSALYVGVDGTGGGLCSRDLARQAACGTTCSRATLAFHSCLEGTVGSKCAFATNGKSAVVHRGALDETSLALIEELALAEAHTPGNHVHRSFGSDGGGNKTTGHLVTWLTPAIFRHAQLVDHLKGLARQAATAGAWHVPDIGALTMRCAEVLEYDGGGNSTGLGWHWDVGSTITTLTMLHPTSDGTGELQVSSNCTVQSIPLKRGDMAVYRSRQRHRVTTVSSARRVLAVEWWRGPMVELPHRPGVPARMLQEPLDSTEDDSSSAGHAEQTEYEVEL